MDDEAKIGREEIHSEDAVARDPRIFCFDRPEEEEAFEQSVVALIETLNERARAMFVSPQNVLRMNHGRQWVHSARAPEPDTSMHSISTKWQIPFADLANNDLELIARSVLPVSEEMSRQFAQNTYRVLGAAAESVGNVVNAKIAGSVIASLQEMMSKIEFGVDREGKVSMPQIHVGTGAYEKLVEAIENMDPEVAAGIELLKETKSKQALEREAERVAKFRRADE